MKIEDFLHIGEELSPDQMRHIKGGVAEPSCNVFTTDTMTPNASATYRFLQDAQVACWADPGCVGIDVSDPCNPE
jgi:hypothetical protein